MLMLSVVFRSAPLFFHFTQVLGGVSWHISVPTGFQFRPKGQGFNFFHGRILAGSAFIPFGYDSRGLLNCFMQCWGIFGYSVLIFTPLIKPDLF